MLLLTLFSSLFATHSADVSIRIVGVVIRMQIAKLKLNVRERGRAAVEEVERDRESEIGRE